MFELGIISDEISGDFARACALIKEWDMSQVELRTMWDKNILELSEHELDSVGESLEQHGLTVTAIASPIFKSPRGGTVRSVQGDFQLSGFESFEGQLELIRRAAAVAQRFGTERIRIFTFWREPWSDALAEDVALKLVEAATLARDLGVVLAVENEPVCVVGTGWELGALFRVVDRNAGPDVRAHIGMLWDPGNASHEDQEVPYPDGYDALETSRLIHVHLKDSIVGADGNRQLVPLGEGTIDYVAQFRRLEADGYRGPVVLEPHYHPEGMSKGGAALACVRAARKVLAVADAS